MKRKLTCIVLVVCILGTLFANAAIVALDMKPQMDIQTDTLSRFGISISDIETIIPLYNVDETIIAYDLENENGFTIVDLNGMIIAQNLSGCSPFKGIQSRVYIKGPMDFYIKEGQQYVNIMNENIVKAVDDFENNIIVSVQRNLRDSYQTMTCDAEITAVVGLTKKHLPYRPREYFYNPTGICMGTAGATLLAYYKDHINSDIAASRHVNSDGVGLTILLAEGSYYRYTSGSAASRAAQALTWYMNVHSNTSYTASYSSTNIFSTVVAKIDSNRPLQAHFNDTEINHSVMVWGYVKDTLVPDNNGIYCTYGWSSSYMDCFVNANYIYGLIWINA